MKIKKRMAVFLIFIYLFSLFPTGLLDNAEAAEIPTISDADVGGGDSNRFYFVAVFEYVTYQQHSGAWVPAEPGKVAPPTSYTYNFDMPNRKIKNVTIDPFNETKINENRSKWLEVFYQSRYEAYRWNSVVGKSISDYAVIKNNQLGIGTSHIEFDLQVSNATLDAINPDRKTVAGGLISYTYNIPMLITIDCDPQLIIKHFDTDGNSLTSVFPNSQETMTTRYYDLVPPQNENYEYVGHKKSTIDDTLPGNIVSGNPQGFTYNNNFNTFFLALYYKKKVSPKPKLTVKHFKTNGTPLNSVFQNREGIEMNVGSNYSVAPPSNAGYIYKGYKSSKTVEDLPSGPILTGNPSPMNFTYSSGMFPAYTVYHYYDDKPITASDGEVKVRHMVRKGTTGTFTMKGENSLVVTPLPGQHTENADNSYGTLLGGSIDYTKYLDTWVNVTSLRANLSIPNFKTAYISFFYENLEQSSFKGDFDIIPGTIEYGEPFTLHPKDFVLETCTYLSHSFKIVKAGNTTGWNGPEVDGRTKDSNFTRATYPSLLGVGTFMVSMKIKTSCGEKWVAEKPLVITDPSNNRPPTFHIGFVDKSEPTKALTQVIEGTVLDLVVIDDPSIPTPHDPDGDSLHFDQFFFQQSTSPFIQSLPNKHQVQGWGMYNITMDTRGFHNVCAQIRDDWGATATACTFISVVAKNPVPIVDCPPSVIENHPISESAFKSNRSYSPIIGRTIDHSKDEWTNKKAFYTNGTDKDITVEVSLHVYDNTGLKSIDPATCTIIVKPDLPPIAVLEVPKLAIRNEPTAILNKSYSPDGDEIVKAEYMVKYDAKNNGFADDAWKPINGTLEKLTFNPDKVGKYLFYVKVTEDYGKSGDTAKTAVATLTLDVVNNAPEVSFEMEGKNPQPDLNASTTIRTDAMMAWPIYVPNSTEFVYNKNNLWGTNGGGSIAAGDAQNFGSSSYRSSSFEKFGGNGSRDWHFPAQQDFGFGANNLSPWRAAESFTQQSMLIDPVTGRDITYDPSSDIKFNSNSKLVYFDQQIRTGSWPDLYNEITIYGLDPTKVSPIEHDWQSGRYKYRDGNPFAYRIQIFYSDHIITWQVAGKNLFVFFEQNGSYKVAVYDAFTGTKLRESTKMINLDVNFTYSDKLMTARGDKVILSRLSGTSNRPGQAYEIFYELSPDLNAKKLNSWFVPNPRVATNQSYATKSPYHFDPEGNTYVFGGFNNGQGSFMDLNVAKYDANMSLVWRRYLVTAGESSSPSEVGAPGMNGSFATLSYSPMEINPFANEITVPVYEPYNSGGYPMSRASLYTLDMKTGNVKRYLDGRWDPGLGNNAFEKHRMGWNGTQLQPYGITTAEGYRTNYEKYGSDCATRVASVSGTQVAITYGCVESGMYVQNGLFLTIQEQYSNSGYSTRKLYYKKGTPSTAPLVRQAFTNGQFLSNVTLKDVEMSYSFRMEDVAYDKETTGLSFRMRDTKNRYALESDGRSFDLVKYVNGARQVLKASTYPFESNKSYGVRIKAVGNKIDVFLNSIPVISVTDGSFAEGRFGYYSNKAFVYFSAFTYKAIREVIEWSDSYAIWDAGKATADIAYKNIQFIDPENDPKAGSYNWTIEHTPRFLNNQGLSAKNGKTFASEQLTFDKVGDYIVTLQAKDDPNPDYRHPSMTFDEYRKPSNAFKKKVTVHRRPVSSFTVRAATDGKVIWTDSSYDPDRYESATKYSTENTGVDYKATRGIFERKYYYKTPSGETVFEKLVTPQEKGLYEVGLAVKDEYAAWSDYTVAYLDIARIPTANTPPVPGFSTSYTNTFRGVPVTINSTAYDREDGARENLPHQYYMRNVTTGDAESLQSTSRTSWTKTFNSLGTFNIRQWVQDSAGAEAQISKQVNIVNRLPVAQVTFPTSTDQTKPTKIMELRPEFKWSYSDADGDAQTRYQLRIYKYGGVQYLDTDVRPGSVNSWRPMADLPERVNLYVMVRVFDGYDWSDWSAPKFFYIETNQPPTADFDWAPKPVYEGDMIKLTTVLDDPDRDDLQVQFRITEPGGKLTTHTLLARYPYRIEAPIFKGQQVGAYSVELTVSDSKADPVVVRKTIQVLPLNILGEVRHTETWNERRQSSNFKATGDKERPRGYDVYWAGEKFVLRARTTATGTATIASRVEVTVDGYTAELTGSGPSSAEWTGELWDERLEKLPDGPLTFVFTAFYSNGTVKSVPVTVTISGNVNQTVGVHRRQ